MNVKKGYTEDIANQLSRPPPRHFFAGHLELYGGTVMYSIPTLKPNIIIFVAIPVITIPKDEALASK
ncbi:hypothetical protein Gasu2_62640 [Galdieria sulphuraria]|nr:hypothetical protein Gasu2_62640 [Galdieria sulphuraria]